MISEQSSQLQELHRQTSSQEQELRQLKRDRDRETGGETAHLHSLLKEKEALIKVRVDGPSSVCLPPPDPAAALSSRDLPRQELMGGQEEDMQPSSKDGEAEVTVLKEQLQLVLKKEREAQVCAHTPAPVTKNCCVLAFEFTCLCSAEGAGRPAFIPGCASGGLRQR